MLKRLIGYFLVSCCLSVSGSLQASFKPLQLQQANAGALSFSYFLPPSSNLEKSTTSFQPAVKGLLVLLHGCAQDGQVFAKQSGFLQQAQQRRFALLVPQQSHANNVQGCFNWFSPMDNQIDQGETLSIKSAILQMQSQFNLTDSYIVGLSAGGAMASNLMSHYPDMFTAGSVVAGIPYPCADNLVKAISCMKSGPVDSPTLLANKIRRSDTHWPQLIVIAGDEDKIVSSKNAEYLAEQWVNLHQLQAQAMQSDDSTLKRHRWQQDSQLQVELIIVKNLAHGIPVNSTMPAGGRPGAFFLESEFSAAAYLSEAWF